jgi:hypothetical protein
MDAERDEGEAQREQLRLELRAREKNQNVFGAGAATLKTGSTMDWMLKPKNRKGTGSGLSAAAGTTASEKRNGVASLGDTGSRSVGGASRRMSSTAKM